VALQGEMVEASTLAIFKMHLDGNMNMEGIDVYGSSKGRRFCLV